MRGLLVAAGALALALALGWGSLELRGPDAQGRAAAEGSPGVNPALVQVAFHDLGGAGFNGDIWVHGDYAYVGTWGTTGGGCLNIGVKVIDISDPLAPILVDILSVPPGTHPNDVKVAAIDTADFQGDLLVGSNESCATGGSRGVQLWDVTDPTNASELGRFDTRGVHNTYLYQRGDSAYVLLAVPFAEVFGPGAGLPASDLQIIDVTDPTSPSLVGEWTIGRDAGLAFGSPSLAGVPGLPPGSDCTPPPDTPALCRGQIAQVYLHDVWASSDGTVAYLSYWDAGLVTLDISDPANPALLGVAIEPLTDEGNAHNAVVDEAANLILVGDEDFASGPWGFLRIHDGLDPAEPNEINTFATENALAFPAPDSGWYTLHNVTVADGLAYLGWYSDGVRVLDLSDPMAPQEVASFVPPDVPDPNGGFFPAKALVWGTSVQDGIVYASDINGGLFVLAYDEDLDGCAGIQEKSADPARGGARDRKSFWDFFDVPTGELFVRDRAVFGQDIGAIVARFGSSDTGPGTFDRNSDPLSMPNPVSGNSREDYHPAYDRTPLGPNIWNLGPPDGSVFGQDIAAVVGQFGDACA